MRTYHRAPYRFVPLAVLASVGCGQEDEPASPAPPCQQVVEPGSPLGTRCGHLVDEQGRVVLLRGVNARVEGLFDVAFDDGRFALEEIPPLDASDAADMRNSTAISGGRPSSSRSIWRAASTGSGRRALRAAGAASTSTRAASAGRRGNT